MSLQWGSDDKHYFRQIGIEMDDDPPRPSGYIVLCWLLFWLTAGGMLWYGILLGGAALLRWLGVNITGMPQ